MKMKMLSTTILFALVTICHAQRPIIVEHKVGIPSNVQTMNLISSVEFRPLTDPSITFFSYIEIPILQLGEVLKDQLLKSTNVSLGIGYEQYIFYKLGIGAGLDIYNRYKKTRYGRNINSLRIRPILTLDAAMEQYTFSDGWLLPQNGPGQIIYEQARFRNWHYSLQIGLDARFRIANTNVFLIIQIKGGSNFKLTTLPRAEGAVLKNSSLSKGHPLIQRLVPIDRSLGWSNYWISSFNLGISYIIN